MVVKMPCKYSRLSFFNFLGHLSFVKADPVAGNCTVQYPMQWRDDAEHFLFKDGDSFDRFFKFKGQFYEHKSDRKSVV